MAEVTRSNTNSAIKDVIQPPSTDGQMAQLADEYVALQEAFKAAFGEQIRIPDELFSYLEAEFTVTEQDVQQPPFIVKRGLVIAINYNNPIKACLATGDLIISLNGVNILRMEEVNFSQLLSNSPQAKFRVARFKSYNQDDQDFPPFMKREKGFGYCIGYMYGIKALQLGLTFKIHEKRVYVLESTFDSIGYMTVAFGDRIIAINGEEITTEERCQSLLMEDLLSKGYCRFVFERPGSDLGRRIVLQRLELIDYKMPPDCPDLADKAVKALKLPDPKPILREGPPKKTTTPLLVFNEKNIQTEHDIVSDISPENLIPTPARDPAAAAAKAAAAASTMVAPPGVTPIPTATPTLSTPTKEATAPLGQLTAPGNTDRPSGPNAAEAEEVDDDFFVPTNKKKMKEREGGQTAAEAQEAAVKATKKIVKTGKEFKKEIRRGGDEKGRDHSQTREKSIMGNLSAHTAPIRPRSKSPGSKKPKDAKESKTPTSVMSKVADVKKQEYRKSIMGKVDKGTASKKKSSNSKKGKKNLETSMHTAGSVKEAKSPKTPKKNMGGQSKSKKNTKKKN